jgi:hypothetical protein
MAKNDDHLRQLLLLIRNMAKGMNTQVHIIYADRHTEFDHQGLIINMRFDFKESLGRQAPVGFNLSARC